MANEELKEKLTHFSLTVSDETKAIRHLINGNRATLSLLNTQDKTTLVNAINELVARAGQAVSLEAIDIAVNDYYVLHPQFFTFDQVEEKYVWLITHPLDHRPAVTVTDSAGSIWVGQLTYPSLNQVRIEFNSPLMGKAILT